MTSIEVAAKAPTTAEVVARLERLPPSRWHVKIRSIIGVAWFFDAFDALAIVSPAGLDRALEALTTGDRIADCSWLRWASDRLTVLWVAR